MPSVPTCHLRVFLAGCRKGDATCAANEVASPVFPAPLMPRVDSGQNKVISQEVDRFIAPKCRRTARRTSCSAHTHWCPARTAPNENRFPFGGALSERFVKLNDPGKIQKP